MYANARNIQEVIKPHGRSNRRGYARMESRDEFMDEIEELMEKAPDEATRKKFERLLMEMK